LSRVGVTYKTVLEWMIDLMHLIHSHNSGLQAILPYRFSTHFQFTVAHALGFSVFNSRILVTGFITVSLSLKITHEVFFHTLMPFLPLFCNCQFRRLHSIKFFCSQAHILGGWRLETRFSTLVYCSILLNTSL
jgi:hypothetical protein